MVFFLFTGSVALAHCFTDTEQSGEYVGIRFNLFSLNALYFIELCFVMMEYMSYTYRSTSVYKRRNTMNRGQERNCKYSFIRMSINLSQLQQLLATK